MNSNNTAIILLSGGLDSLVALDYAIKNNIEIRLALTFDYGQKAAAKELEVTAKICEYYNIEHKVIKLGWLEEITQTSLVSDAKIPTADLNTGESAQSVWVPNRNALFLNIAGCYCDSMNCKYVIYGANKEEGQNFPDNTEEFRAQVSNLFKTSTLVKPVVLAPLINYDKGDIVKIAIDNSVPLELVWSCYKSGSRHCGKCESCNHLKKALIANRCEEYLDILFEDENKVY